MSDTIVENQICKTCGTEIRKGALFCYNCGNSVVSEVISAKPKRNKIEEAENTNGNKFIETKSNEVPETVILPIVEIPENLEPKPAIIKETNLKSAAALRKKSRSISNKKVEIIWEEHEDVPNVRFVLAAITLTVSAAIIFWFALYYK